MSLSRLTEILAVELITCFNKDMALSSDNLTQYANKITTIEEISKINQTLQPLSAYIHVGRLDEIYQETKKCENVDAALDLLGAKYAELAAERPQGTTHYQNTYILAQALLNVFNTISKDIEFTPLQQEKLLIIINKPKEKSHEATYSFGTVRTNGELVAASPFWNTRKPFTNPSDPAESADVGISGKNCLIL